MPDTHRPLHPPNPSVFSVFSVAIFHHPAGTTQPQRSINSPPPHRSWSRRLPGLY